MYDGYKNLPIIQIDSWEELNLNILTEYVSFYKNKKCFNNVEELTLDFWVKKIKNALC
jgi:hypothetical protein